MLTLKQDESVSVSVYTRNFAGLSFQVAVSAHYDWEADCRLRGLTVRNVGDG